MALAFIRIQVIGSDSTDLLNAKSDQGYPSILGLILELRHMFSLYAANNNSANKTVYYVY